MTSLQVEQTSAAARLAVRLMAAWQELFEEARRRQQQEKTVGAVGAGAGANAGQAVAGRPEFAPLLLASDGNLHPAPALRGRRRIQQHAAGTAAANDGRHH